MNKHITNFSLKIVKEPSPIKIIFDTNATKLATSAQQATEAMRNMSSALAQTQMSIEEMSAAMQTTYNTLLESDTQELIDQLFERWANI